MTESAARLASAATRPENVSTGRLVARASEFILLFLGLPALFAFRLLNVPLIPFLLFVMACCLIVLLRDRRFDRRQLVNAAALPTQARSIALTFVLGAAGIALFAALYDPARLFELVEQHPLLWLAIMVLYPLLSVYPQELLYRTFFFHRYRVLFRNRYLMILASATAFGYMHIVFQNVIAVAMTLAGGLLFAHRYDKTRSTLASSLEHALYGCFIFTVGLGWYFYSGSIG